MRPRRKARQRVLLMVLCACACDAPAEPKTQLPAAVPSVTLRFRPDPGARFREHWTYDLAVPGEGIRREALSFDIALLSRLDQGSYAINHSVHEHISRANGQPAPPPNLRGVSFNEQWGSDRSLIADLGLTARTPLLAAAMRAVVQSASFGLLIEYPDQAVALRDSWSIEPRTHAIPAGLAATLRPTYTLEALEKHQGELEAVIAADLQVDLVPTPVVDGVSIEGGGSASGTLRVRVRDGWLREARTVLHFSQEIMVQGSEVLGFREISATAHISTTPVDEHPPALGKEPITLDPPDDDDRECAQSLSSAAQRVGKLEGHQRVHLVSALHGDDLPEASGGVALRVSARNLVLISDPKRVELDGAQIELKDLAQAVEAEEDGPRALYLYAEAALPLERLRSVIAALPKHTLPRLVVRDSAAITPAPRASRWLEERLRQALSAPNPDERRSRLRDLLLAHVTLCEPALDAFHSAFDNAGKNSSELPTQIVKAFGRCGCTSTNLEGLEATLLAIFGSPDLRSLPLPRRPQDPIWLKASNIRELAALLSAKATTL